MANKNFIVKNGLEVGGQEVVSSSGVVTSAALGGQTLASTDSPTFNNLTLTNDIAVGGDLNLTGDLNITGDVNSLSVTDLDVTDQTITLGAGQVESASGGSGIVVDGSGASILWDETNNKWDLNKSINVTGSITSSGITYMNRTGDGNFINFNSDGSEVGSIETQGNEIVLMSVDRGLRIRTSATNSIIPVGTARTNLDDTMSLGSSGARFTTLYLSDNIFNWGKAGSVTVFNQDGTTADFRVESTGEQHMLFVDGGLNRIGMANSAPNAKLHIDSTAATGDATNPALQIGGTTTYRLGMYTTTEGGIIDNANGDDGLQFHTKNAGEAVRITANGNLQMIGQTSSFESPGLTYHTNNYLYLRGGTSGLILADDSGINTVQIIDGSAGYINFETGDGSSRMRIKHDGKIGIGTIVPDANLEVRTTQSMAFTSDTVDSITIGTSGTNKPCIKFDTADTTHTNRVWAIENGAGGRLNFFRNGLDVLKLNQDGSIEIPGNVGIGTDSPAVPLHINSLSQVSNRLAIFESDINNTNEYSTISVGHNQLSANFGLMLTTSDTAYIGVGSSGNAFDPTTGTGLYVNANGKVGIGETSPDNILHIKTTASGGPQIQMGDGTNYSFINFDGTNLQLSTQRDMVDGTWYNTGKSWGGINIKGESIGSKITMATAGNSNTSPTTHFLLDRDGHLILGSSTTAAGKLSVYTDATNDPAIYGYRSTSEFKIVPFLSNGAFSSLSNVNDSGLFFSDNFVIAKHASGYYGAIFHGNGSIFIGTESEATGSTGGATFSADSNNRRNLILATTSTSNLELVEFRNPNGTVGTIKSNGTSTSYNTSSDYRLKENVTYEFNALDRVTQLKPARFNFITDADTVLDGFLAHEVSSVVPEAVSGEKDETKEKEVEVTPAQYEDDGETLISEAVMETRTVPVYQGIDQSKLVPLLTKAIQEQQTIIDDLKSRLDNAGL